MNCVNCGGAISEGAKFCGTCGAPVAAVQPAAGPQPHPVGPALPNNDGPAANPQPTTGIGMGAIVGISVVTILLFAAASVGVFLFVRQRSQAGAKSPVAQSQAAQSQDSEPPGDGAGSHASDPALDEDRSATEQDALTEPEALPAIEIRELTAKPKKGTEKEATRTALLDAARDYMGTDSLFYVNQLFVAGSYAIGDVGAERGGSRVCVVWESDPWHVVWVGEWDAVASDDAIYNVDGIPQGLVARLDWSKPWPKKFKFR